jgi:hypothetical protein
MIMNNELGRMWKEAVMTNLKVPAHHFYEGAEENDESPQSG